MSLRVWEHPTQTLVFTKTAKTAGRHNVVKVIATYGPPCLRELFAIL